MINDGLTILQWNCRGLYRKIPELKQLLTRLEKRPDLLILQETHLIDRYSPRIPDYNVYRKDKSAHCGGQAIFVRNDLPFSIIEVPKSSKIELQCIHVRSVYIYNIYIPPNSCIENKRLSFLDDLPKRSLLFGDFNAHHHSWSTSANPSSNQLGRKLFDFFDKNGLVLLNASYPTRINISATAVNRWSLLDLSLASTNIASKCHTTVIDELLGSDHYVILTSFNERVLRTKPLPRKWALNKANWKKFSQLVDASLQNRIRHDADTEYLNTEIIASLISAAEIAIPRSKNIGKSPVPWWNADCDRAVRRKRAAFLKMRRSFDIAHIIEYKRFRSECRRIIIQTKRSCWEEFCASLDNAS